MGRRENVEVFEDTRRLYSKNTVLKDAVQSASQEQRRGISLHELL